MSVGYSACYWYQVREREWYENLAIARLLNGKVECITVEREERPDPATTAPASPRRR